MLQRYKHRRLLDGTPLRSISSAPRNGRVKIVGRVSGNAGVTAPFSGVACVGYAIELHEWDNGTTYPFMDVTSSEPFEIADDTGSATVEPDRGTLVLAPRRHRIKGHNLSDFRRFADFVSRYGRNPYDAEGIERSVNWVETVLLPGQRVTVVGSAHWGFGDQDGYRDPAQVLRIRASTDRPLVVVA